jgi:competence protein ComFC
MYHRIIAQLSTVEKWRNARDFFLDFLFPAKCISCSREGAYFCTKCRSALPAESKTSNGAISLWNYENEKVREAIRELKYRGKKAVAHDLAASLYEKLLEVVSEDLAYCDPLGEQNSDDRKYFLVPVPMHKKRLHSRGYNHAELLAKEIFLLDMETFGFVPNILIKTRETPSQVSVKSREARLCNIRGSFAVPDPSLVLGQKFIVIDDVTTTGATLAEAQTALLKSGAKQVLTATIAH